MLFFDSHTDITPNMKLRSSQTSITVISVMMFLQYAVRGIWLPFLAKYLVSSPETGGLGFTGSQIGWIMGLGGAVGAIAAPFIAGQIADRYFNAEKTLAALLFISGIINIFTAMATTYWAFLTLSIAYSITFIPTLSLSNSVAFQNLTDSDRQFPVARAVGTIGWITATVLFSILWLGSGDTITNTHRIVDSLTASGIISIIYAVFCWSILPASPPNGAKSIAFLKAFKLMLTPNMLILLIATLMISMIHNAYYFRLSPYLVDQAGFQLKWTGAVMAVGYGSEVLVLAALGLYIKKIGYRTVILIGVASYILRFAIFGFAESQPLIILAMSMHGINFACFFAASFMFVEKIAPPDIRHSAQTLYGVINLGIGPIIAGFYNGFFDRFQTDGIQSYSEFWLTGSTIAIAIFSLMALTFWPKREKLTTHAEPELVAVNE